VARRFKPYALKLISGSKRLPKVPEPQPVGDLQEPPAWLTPAQIEIWNYAILHAPCGLLRRLDRSVLTIWAIASDLHRQASEMVARHGALIKGPDGTPMQSPCMQILNKQSSIMLRAAALLGFSPASRAGIAMTPSGGSNPFDRNGKRPPPDGS